jgi:large subunit ribosomal protein L24
VAGLFVKKGDTVLVVGGRDKGVKGKVISASPERSRVLVEGVQRGQEAHQGHAVEPRLAAGRHRHAGGRRCT